jgi:hypothetical protein
MWGGCSPTSAEDSLPAAVHVTDRQPLLAKPDPDSAPLAHHVPAGSFLQPTEMVSLSGGRRAYQVKYEVHGHQVSLPRPRIYMHTEVVCLNVAGVLHGVGVANQLYSGTAHRPDTIE